jgi:hypothetical protein
MPTIGNRINGNTKITNARYTHMRIENNDSIDPKNIILKN